MDLELMNILLVDDAHDDCNFFKKALEELHSSASLTIVRDCMQLMKYLDENSTNLPDVLFLDLNMSIKNGIQCLNEIKENKDLEKLPVVIYSVIYSRDHEYEENMIKLLITLGALYFIRKTPEMEVLKLEIKKVLSMVAENKSSEFLINP